VDFQVSNLERQNSILALLEEQKRVSVSFLCQSFSISEATARRDLEYLASAGKIRRVRGGAIALVKSSPELPVLQRGDEHAGEKDQIGRAAAGRVADGETIFLGSGTTIHAIARHLPEFTQLTVLTNSLPIINSLVGRPGINLIILGGFLRESELSFIGHIAEQALSEVRADKVFISARAVSTEYGVTNDFMAETATDRAILKIGRQTILAVDHSKFGRVSTAFLAPLQDFDLLITDRGISPEDVRALEQQGLQVELAPG
jgi:DeoR/GlpR family transcriptional regulator of sugar metabolism